MKWSGTLQLHKRGHNKVLPHHIQNVNKSEGDLFCSQGLYACDTTHYNCQWHYQRYSDCPALCFL